MCECVCVCESVCVCDYVVVCVCVCVYERHIYREISYVQQEQANVAWRWYHKTHSNINSKILYKLALGINASMKTIQ